MSLALFKKDIEDQTLAPVYLLYGDDRHSLLQGLKILKEFLGREDPSGSNIELFQGKDVAVDQLVEAANSSSFFSRKLIIVDNIPFFEQRNNSEEDGEESPDGIEPLIAYLGDCNPASCLILVATKVNKGRRLFKAIAKAGKIIEFVMPNDIGEWQDWILGEVKQKGKKITTATASFLVEWSGHNTGILGSEIEKLVIYASERTEITKDDITAVCIPVSETTVFKMLDGIAARNSREALQRLGEVLEREHYLKVNTMIVRQVRLLLTACLLRAKGGRAEELIKIASIKPYEANKVFRQSSKFTFAMLEKAMEDCLEMDIAFKTSGGDPRLLLEMMVIKLCRG